MSQIMKKNQYFAFFLNFKIRKYSTLPIQKKHEFKYLKSLW